MVDHDATAKACRRVDVDAEDQRRPALEKLRQGTAVLSQERVSVTVGLNGVEALEEQQGFQRRLAGRVAFADAARSARAATPISTESATVLSKTWRNSAAGACALARRSARMKFIASSKDDWFSTLAYTRLAMIGSSPTIATAACRMLC
jgi:hypothetical protein